MDDSRDREKGGGEWETKKKALAYELLPLSGGVHGAFMSGQLIVSVGFLNGELRRIVSWLFSCVQACHETKWKKRKEKKMMAVKQNYPQGCFWNISFLFCRHRPYGEEPHELTYTHTTAQRSDHLGKTGHFKTVIFHQLFSSRAV